MKVTFILPPAIVPGIGGYAVVYGYAARLAARGHRVTVLHHDPAKFKTWGRNKEDWKNWARRIIKNRAGELYGVSPSVRSRSVPLLVKPWLRRQDAVVATAWMTAQAVADLEIGSRGLYLIQHHEHWSGDLTLVDATWRLPLRRIVISEWLADVAAELDAEPVALIRNGLDLAIFRVSEPVADRDPHRVAMMWSDHDWKRSALGLQVLRRVREQVPTLTAEMFGTCLEPDLPDWATWRGHLGAAEVSELFNGSAVMVNPSSTEGWCLPAAEAMACGAAVVTTVDGAARDFARDGDTAVVVPTDDEDGLVAAVVDLLEKSHKRAALAARGASFAGEHLSWDRAVDEMEATLAGH